MLQQMNTMQLFPYQEIGASFMAKHDAALLADEPGLGKTAQAIVACAQSIPSTHSLSTPVIVVICPASVRGVWAREFGRFWPTDKHSTAKLIVESYDKVVRGALDKIDLIDALILDEGHYLKSKCSKRTQKIFGEDCDGKGGLVDRADRVYVLSGTPTPNNSSELWPMLRALAPELILAKNGRPMNYWSFVNKFCKTQDNGFGIQIVGNRNSEELKARLTPFFLRRRKVDVLKDLPPILFDTLPVYGKMPDAPSGVLVNELAGAETDDEVVEALRKTATHVAELRRLTGLAKVPGVIDWIKEWFEGGGGKLVVFAHHRDVIKALNTDPALNKIMRYCVTGETPDFKRNEYVNSFQSDHRTDEIFIGQIQAAGTGITLTASSDVLFAESSWVPSDNQQAAMRVHRIGQRNACTVRFATLANSIDERIQAVVARKTSDIAQLFS